VINYARFEVTVRGAKFDDFEALEKFVPIIRGFIRAALEGGTKVEVELIDSGPDLVPSVIDGVVVSREET